MPVPCTLCAPCSPSPDTAPDPNRRGGKFRGAPWGCPISGVQLPGAHAAPPLGPPLGAPARKAAFVPGKGGAAPRGDTSCCRPRGRSLPGNLLLVGPAAEGRTGATAERGPEAGARPASWVGPAALRALRLCWCAGLSSFGKTLAVPPPGSVDPAAALAQAPDLRPPVTSAFSVRNGPQPAPPSPGAEPRAPGSRRTPESPPGLGPAGGCFWRSFPVSAPPAPGLGGNGG